MAWVCLMYHDVAPRPTRVGGGPERFTVPPSSFELMLDTIAEAGFAGSSLADALDGAARRHVGITFDDGTIGQFENAVPALRARRMTATFFVTTDWVGTSGFMTWEQLRQLTEWGMSVQSHTKSHPYLSELSDSDLRLELAQSKSILDRQLAQDTTQLALPQGNGPRWRARGHLRDAGYQVVATSRWGLNTERGIRDGPRWIRRCTAPHALTAELARRIVAGDPVLTLKRYPREVLLNGVRALLGPTRYAAWRRWVLDALDSRASLPPDR